MLKGKDKEPGFYNRYTKEQLILRDHLAVDRTVLANENTFLAYVRTALTFFVSGITFVHFFGYILVEIIGWIFIPIGVSIFIAGWLRYQRMQKTLKILE
ncbi:MAG: DUF202 domain-containing protein [Calditrichaeota bacterium]|nr:DUF202 domain-containing protein [Calditrichota bacterium]MCB0293937.1 DUF202 domain-containing protein [Calditrichota bacterium]MCB0305603.1 DUF202 domain-containing protein [Calditrichota bacterium]MCB9088705.1 DUF202 domain-containing protein [Calditrichia bacterium]